MAAGDTQITIAGNLVDDPELRFTPAGQPVARFRVASTPRFRDNSTGEWKDGDSLFLTCNVWRQAAENSPSLLTGVRHGVSILRNRPLDLYRKKPASPPYAESARSGGRAPIFWTSTTSWSR